MDNVLRGTVVDPDTIYGKSAYEIALMHGFDGTEEEWLQSLVDQNMFVEASREAADRANDSAGASATSAQEAFNHASQAYSSMESAQGASAVAQKAANASLFNADRAEAVYEEMKPQAGSICKRLDNLEAGLPASAWQIDESVAYQKAVPANANPYAAITKIGGMSYNDNGVLRSSPVTSITRRGKNLIGFLGKTEAVLEPVGTGSNTHVRKIEFDKYYIGVTANNYSSVSRGVTCEIKADNEVVVTSSSAGYGVGIPIKCKPNTTYYYSGVDNDATHRSFRIGMYTANGEFIRLTENEGAKSYAFTTPDNCYIIMAVFTPTGGENVPTTYTNFQLEEDSVATEYKPYHEPITTALPTELLTLEGYGEGIDESTYNYIDWRPAEGIKQWVQKLADGSTKITDLSDVLSDDNLFEVEGGGTLTFDNEHQNAVPSTVLYQLNTDA